jgi:hypothetical protein
LVEQVHSVHHGHAHVGNDGIVLLLLECCECGRRAIDEFHVPFVAHRVQTAPQTVQHIRFVIYKQQTLFHTPAFAEATVLTGSVMKNVVPLPTSVSNQILPPCFFTTTV